MNNHQQYMQRCIELALKGAGHTAPNPMVGAVLVYDNIIIGEGWHQQYGEAHAEVNCLASVKHEHKKLIKQSTLYVSLEPCAHFGKTPPCADLIIDNRIPKVIIGCRDPFKEVDGRGIEKLQQAGIEVITGVLEEECRELNKRFFTYHTKRRPYIILKWAQTADAKIAASSSAERLFISNEYSNRLVHKWRSEEDAILVGTNTARQDDPELTTRLWQGKSPIRIIIDRDLKLPASLKIFNKQANTVILNTKKNEEENNLRHYKIEKKSNSVKDILDALYDLKIQSVLVEGGAKLLQSFIDARMWDEVRIIKNEQLVIINGLAAPKFTNDLKFNEERLLSDRVEYYINEH